MTWYRWNGIGGSRGGAWGATTGMKKGTNTIMKYQRGQTRLSSQDAKSGLSKFTLRTYVSLLPYYGADHLTFEGEGGEWVGDFWSAIFFSTNLLGRIFFPLLICLQDFFPLEMVSPSFCKNVFTFTLCYCSNGPDIELQSLKKFSKLYKIIIVYSYVFGKSFFTLMFYEITIFSYYKVMQIKQVWKLK